VKQRPALPPLDERQRYSIDEAIAYLRSSRRTLFEDIREGRLATIKEGKRRFVPGSEIARRSQLPTHEARQAVASAA
jgi:hypothetical protein